MQQYNRRISKLSEKYNVVQIIWPKHEDLSNVSSKLELVHWQLK